MVASNNRRSTNGRFVSPNSYGGHYDPLVVANQLRLNDNPTSLSRISRSAASVDPRRDVNVECGYPDTGTLTAEVYRDYYDRHPIARRVVNVLPLESWRSNPYVFESEDNEVNTPFETAFDELGQRLKGPQSHFGGEGCNPLWEFLLRADILSGIGHFGILLLGFSDGSDLSQPVTRRDGLELLYVRPFDESLVEITAWESNPADPRFGLPKMYSVTFSDPRNATTGIGVPNQTADVHHSRVLHLADHLESSEVIGTPRMRPVFNRLYDLQKLYGGSAEMYWKGAFPGLSFESIPQLGPDVKINASTLKNQIEEYQNGLQRYFVLTGMTARSLAPQVVDPSPQIEAQLDAIAIELGIPKRIFVGSERGELASSQDARSWNNRLRQRQQNYITPRIVIPLIDRLIEFGVLPEPADGYKVRWKDLDEADPAVQATIALKRTEAIAKYVQGGVDAVIAPFDYLTKFHGMEDDEALEVVETAMGQLEEEEGFLKDFGQPDPVELAEVQAEARAKANPGALDDQGEVGPGRPRRENGGPPNEPDKE